MSGRKWHRKREREHTQKKGFREQQRALEAGAKPTVAELLSLTAPEKDYCPKCAARLTPGDAPAVYCEVCGWTED